MRAVTLTTSLVLLGLSTGACSSGSAARATGAATDGGASPGADAGGPAVRDGGDGGGGDPAALAAEAFVWGFPLVVSQRTLQTFGAIALNKLFNQTVLTDASTRLVVSPNQDTLYSISVLDLRSEPMVLEVPDATDRYWTYQFLDPWTNSFHYIGTRATGGKGGTFAVTPPGFSGALPASTEEVKAPTPEVFLLGRYVVKDAADIPNVTGLARSVSPLDVLTGSPAPAPPPPLGAPPGTPQTTGEDGASFFDELGDALASNPPYTDADVAALARFAPLGIGPGLHPAMDAKTGGSDGGITVLSRGAADGMARIVAAGSAFGASTNGWSMRLDIGTYDDPLIRAVVAKGGWGANIPAEAVYAHAGTDGAGAALTGASNYVMHFAADQLPPLKALGFWSVTLYGPDHFFVENAIKRYAIGDRTPNLAFNADGSLDLYVQNASPTGHEANWLPAPASAFELVTRLYLPDQPILDGSYQIPPLTAQ